MIPTHAISLRNFLAIALTAATCACTQAQPIALRRASQTSDIAAIREVFSEWEATWNRHDIRTFAGLFREDAIWVGLSGRVWIGRAAIEAEHVESHRTILRNSQQTVRIDNIRLVGPDVALVLVSTVVTGDETARDGVSRARKMFTLTRGTAGEWLIASGQNTRLSDGVPY